MGRYYDEDQEREADRWEREHEFRIRWGCPLCRSYEYEDERYCNQALPCPDCGVKCVQIGESHLG